MTFRVQVQTILSDNRSQDLFDILRKERDLASPSTQDLVNSRKNTERILGPDENLFRMVWVSHSLCDYPTISLTGQQLPDLKTVTIQLLGKDDSSFDDSEALTGRWQAYVESYVSVSSTLYRPTCDLTDIVLQPDETDGLTTAVIPRPFLRR